MAWDSINEREGMKTMNETLMELDATCGHDGRAQGGALGAQTDAMRARDVAFGRFRAALCLALAAATALALGGCAAGQDGQAEGDQAAAPVESAQAGYTFTDDLGNQVTVDNPQRVVACMGSFADVWQLAGGTLVGASQDAFADYGIDAQSVQSVGDFSSLSLEAILACDPDFVIMTGSTSGRGGGVAQTDLKDALEASGVPVAYFTVTTFDDYLRMLRVCCDITGRDDLYAEHGEAVAQQVDAAVQQAKGSVPQGARVAILTSYSQGLRALPSSSTAGSILSQLGASNVVDETPGLLKDFSLEGLLKENPDYIFLIPMGDDEETARRNLEAATTGTDAWSQLDAVKNGHCAVLDKSLFLYKPNDRWAQAYQELAAAFGE